MPAKINSLHAVVYAFTLFAVFFLFQQEDLYHTVAIGDKLLGSEAGTLQFGGSDYKGALSMDLFYIKSNFPRNSDQSPFMIGLDGIVISDKSPASATQLNS